MTKSGYILHVTHIDMKGLCCVHTFLLFCCQEPVADCRLFLKLLMYCQHFSATHVSMFSIYVVRFKLRQCLQGTEFSCMEFNYSNSIDLNEYYSCLLPQVLFDKSFLQISTTAEMLYVFDWRLILVPVWLLFLKAHSYSLWYTASLERRASHEQKV